MLFNTLKTAFGEEGNDILRQLISEAGYDSTKNLPSSVFQTIMNKVFDMCEAKRNEEAQQSYEEPDEYDYDEPVDEGDA